MLRPLVALAVVCSSVAFAKLPDPNKVAAAKALKPSIDALVQRGAAMEAHTQAFEALLKQMGGEDKGSAWVLSRVATAEELAKFDSELAKLTAESQRLNADCDALKAKIDALESDWSEEKCTRWFDSMHEDTSKCVQWREMKVLEWPVKKKCDEAAEAVRYREAEYSRNRSDWDKALKSAKEREVAEAVYLQPVSGSPQQRVIPLPSKFVQRTSTSRTVDALGLFDAVNPSHFVFLRKNVSEAPRYTPEEGPVGFSRTLKKGEAVLPIECVSCGDRHVNILSIDGAEGIVSAEDLALAPLAGAKTVVLTAADLNVKNDEGKVLAGPTWLAPDATGFSLDEPSDWLELLDPPEPRSQRFFDARNKVLACYKKKIDGLDPEGRFSKYYDVVTYGRNGIESVESAAVNFDRKACAACGCKKFNDTKRALIKEAIAPAQKKAFVPYQALLEKLSKTDFAAASKGAPKGKATKVEAL